MITRQGAFPLEIRGIVQVSGSTAEHKPSVGIESASQPDSGSRLAPDSLPIILNGTERRRREVESKDPEDAHPHEIASGSSHEQLLIAHHFWQPIGCLDFPTGCPESSEQSKKHSVDFHEAATVFDDPLSMTFPDPDHSDTEQRFLTIGQTIRGRVVVVAHTEDSDNIRIISARHATRREQSFYEENQLE
jgi:uncharacterized protein